MSDDDLLDLPVFPLRKSVLYPYVLGPLSAGRSASMSALEAALGSEDKQVAVVAQRDVAVEHPGPEDLFGVGTRAVIKRMARSEETIEVLLQGVERIELVDIQQREPHMRARFRRIPVSEEYGPETEALQREIWELAREYQSLAQPSGDFDLGHALRQIEDPLQLVYILGSMIDLELEDAQELLEASTVAEAMSLLHKAMTHELQVLRLRKEIAGQAESEMSRQQREHLLRQQMRAIQQELGEEGSEEEELAELRRRLDEASLPEAVREQAGRELSRLGRMSPSSPDYQVTRSYVELILELPWSKETEDELDLKHARQVLDEDHYGLREIKERILEHLAVLKLNPEAKAPILCFVGPPGVGKTSLGQSIARALGRRFERFSLGGLHDEAELRGHRRTYVGAMPGRIIQAMRRVGVKNPVLMLDEVDKVGRDFRGDPASALLEILDPAQNYEFRDNYLDLQFDLSRTFFILTANTTDTIPGPLLDRVETIRLSGYSVEEKLEIARRYLIERQRRQAGLADEQLVIPDDTVKTIINRYTREAGVRELERMLGRLARKQALRLAEGEAYDRTIGPDDLAELLGPERFFIEQARKGLSPGVVAGLAWTETGGDVLYVEAIQLPEGEGLTLTGQLGSIMQESAKAAHSHVVSQSETLAIDIPKGGIHIHVPAGAIPKDGPSAGVTIAAAIASLYAGLPARSDTAMTGEITLSGLVLPVGGVKEKVLAARRAGISRVILPAQNEKDLRDLPEDVRQEMEIVLAEQLVDVIEAAIPEMAVRAETA